ncbi:hypothetical protein [Aeromicrobium sp. 9AM]|uniref:hypothetical protein n=1 Tax=Aeromicrobium sp. 9AM TaxID=2653126 RepID=UPI0012F346E9|nr:hypothetical protein [Aeromicrobium sp. 9AM]VXC00812.1 conserved exported hypothetical protein [Aeromicrobium sp. 9AM]
MKRMLGTIVVLVLFTAGCGSGPTSEGNDPTVEQTSASPEATPETTAPPADSSDLVVTPGKVGDVKAGMTKEEALATGFFDADVEGVEGCTFPLQWKKQFEGVDVLTREDGSIGSLGVTKGGPVTAEGIGVGSTLADVKAAYLELSAVKEAGFDQAGVFHTVGDDHIGFLFGEATPASITDSSKVSFMEVTSGKLPELMRSGC